MFQFREGTTDKLIFDQVVLDNEYRLPSLFEDGDVVIDIGAHIGSFTYAALRSGASRVYAVEADGSNFDLASRNLSRAILAQRVELLRAAVWRSDEPGRVLYHGGFGEAGTEELNTGGVGVIWAQGGEPIETIAFDRLIEDVLKKSRRIRLLKIDCEGSEWPILLTSKRLDMIHEVCGEFHEIGGPYDKQTPPFKIDGYSSFTVDVLEEFFTKRGYRFCSYRGRTVDGRVSPCGLFFAVKAPLLSGLGMRFYLRLKARLMARQLARAAAEKLTADNRN